MKQFLIVFIFLFPFSIGYCQVVSVKDMNNQPLELVLIKSYNPNAVTETNNFGKANITSFKNSLDITFQLLGYKKKSVSYEELKRSNFIVALSSTNISIDQIIISATKWGQSKNEIASRAIKISPKKVEFQNSQTAADLLNISGEVYVQKSQQGGGSPMIRGFATNRVLISVDGIRMNNAIFRSGNLQNVISLDPFAIENTEVIFGPGSIIYGSDAIGGSMNFYTMRPQFSMTSALNFNGNAVFRYSSANNENTGHLNFNFGYKKIASLTSVSFNSFGNLDMGSKGPNEYLRNEYVKVNGTEDKLISNDNPELQIPTGFSQLNIMQKLRFSPNEKWYIDFGLIYSRTSDYDRYDRLIRFKNGIPINAQWYYGPQKWLMNNITVTNLNSTKFYDDLAIRIAYQYFEESRNDRDFQKITLRERKEQVDAYSINVDLNKNFNLNNSIIYGIESIYNKVNSIGAVTNILTGTKEIGASRYPNSSWFSIAGYFVYRSKLQKDLHLQLGSRYNYFNLNSEFNSAFYPLPFTNIMLTNDSFTGSLGLVYSPIESWSIGLNLSTGFRAPNVDDVGKVFDSEPGSVVVPNPKLKEEYAYNVELNATKIFEDILEFDVSGYYTFLDNAMVRDDFTLNGLDSIYYDNKLSKVQAIQNASSAYVWGIQAGIEFNISKNLFFSSIFNYQQGKEKLSNGNSSSLRHAAPIFGSNHIIFSDNNIKVDFYMVYNGQIDYSQLANEEKNKTHLYAIDRNGNPFSPSWLTLNLKFSYRHSKFIAFNLGIENISDQRYRTYSSGIAAPGRNFILSSKISF